jgi:hypothetical protein
MSRREKTLVERIRENNAALNGRSAHKATVQEARRQPKPAPMPYRPFPTEALPPVLRAFVEQGAAALGCDASFLALPALSVVAALIGNSHTIRLKRGWCEPAVIWTAIIGDSGTLKSPAVSAVVAPLHRMQRQLLKLFKDGSAQHRKEQELYDERKRKAKQDKKPFHEEPPEEPPLPRVVTGDITIERLAELLQDNPKGVLTCRDELGGWLGSFTRYKGKEGGSDLPNWLEMHRAGTIQVDRKTGERRTLFISHAAVSITGGIQPGALARALTTEHMDVGLGARILMAMPPKQPKRWTDVEIDLDVQGAYDKLLEGLRDLQMVKGRDGEREPFPLRMTPEAKAAWVKYYQEWAQEQLNVNGELAAAYSKIEGYAARLALLHHVVSRVGTMTDCEPIEAVSIEAGITLAKWFAYEARRIYSVLHESEDACQERRLIEFIRAHDGRMTARRLHLSNTSRYPDTNTAEAALDALAEAGLGEWVASPSSPQGGRPTRTLALTPHTTPYETYETSPGEGDGPLPGSPIPPTKPTGSSENLRENKGFVGSEVRSTDPDPLSRPLASPAAVPPSQGFRWVRTSGTRPVPMPPWLLFTLVAIKP